MRYPGGKGKCFHQVVNLLPPHEIYIETHLGGGAVLRNKKPATRSIGIDRDRRVIAYWRRRYPNLAEYRQGDAVAQLEGMSFSGCEVVYADPPYLPATRARERVYRFDYSEEDHRRLLEVLLALPCAVIISGYSSRLYREALSDWNRCTFRAQTHAGLRQESLWFNYPRPRRLHDHRFLGRDYREREIIKRRLDRLKLRLARLSPVERSVVRDYLTEFEEER
jgi:site-specific DNA-adenine methylase